MKASQLVGILKARIEVEGDFDVVCPGDHQNLYKVSGVETTYIEDYTEYQMEEKHVSDIEDFIADGGTPTKVFVVFG